MKPIYSIIIILAVLALIFVGGEIIYSQNQHISTLKQEIEKFKDADSTTTVKVKALTTKAELVERLQAYNRFYQNRTAFYKSLIDNYVQVKNKTTDTLFFPLYIVDTLQLRDTVNRLIKVSYTGTHVTKWDSFIVSLDTNHNIKIDYTIKNEYSVWSVDNKNDIDVFVKNINPHTTTTEVVSYKIPKQKPKRLAWLAGGFLGGLTLSLLK